MATHTRIEEHPPESIASINLEPRGKVFPSPALWKNEIFYQILPDRFSDGREEERPLFDPKKPDLFRAQDRRAWMAAGLRFNGGTLRGIRSKLDYLQGLGITGLWLNPPFKQRSDLQTYHGYAIQDFLDIDPRFGTRQELRDLVDDAHERGMYVLLDVVIDHTGNNWFYGPDLTGLIEESLPYRYAPPYSFGGWRSGEGGCVPEIASREDGCWPRELQEIEHYNRCGAVGFWSVPTGEDPMDDNAEFRRGDFFDLKKLNSFDPEVLNAVSRCFQYWIALSDCDGFRIDAAKHIPKSICRHFAFSIFRYAQSIGKDNFLLVGEITDNFMSARYLSLFGSVVERALTAVLDINGSPDLLAGAVKGTMDPRHFFSRYGTDTTLDLYLQTGRIHVSVLDDHDMSCRPHKARFAAGNPTPNRAWQSAHAVAVQLTTPGIPCIYYGTEQGFDGSETEHDYSIEPQRFGEDRYVREAMFGAPFGAFGTTGCHFFDRSNPTYLRIAAVAQLRNSPGYVGRTLRMGMCYPRETSFCGYPFAIPGAGELFAWSMVLADHEVVMVLNTHGLEARGAIVTVAHAIHPPGTNLRVLYRADWSDKELRDPPTRETVTTRVTDDRRSVFQVELPAAGMMILG